MKVTVTIDDQERTFKATKDAPFRAIEQAVEHLREAAKAKHQERDAELKAEAEQEQQSASYARAGRELVVTPEPASGGAKGRS